MKRNIIFVVTTFILVAVIMFFSAQTVTAQKQGDLQIDANGIRQMEKEYVEKVKEVLISEHITNSGVTMTKIIYEDGSREYTVVIHNDIIRKLSEAQRTELETKLAKTSLPIPNSKVFHEFLILE